MNDPARFPLLRPAMLTGAAAMLLLSSPLRAQGDILVDVPWSNVPPQRLALIGSGAPIPIIQNSQTGFFSGRYPRSPGTPTFDNLNLVGWWNNEEARLLYLRIYPDTARLNLRVWRPLYSECRRELIRPLNVITDDRGAALESYYRAKALYELANDNRCSGERRSAVALAWFNRAYELTRLDCAFRLSPDAIRAYREFDSAYVARYIRQARGREIQCTYAARNALLRRGDLRGASSICVALVEALRDDASLRRFVETDQRLSLGVLEHECRTIEDERTGRSRPRRLAGSVVGGVLGALIGRETYRPKDERRDERRYQRRDALRYGYQPQIDRRYEWRPEPIVPAQLNLSPADPE